MLPCYLLLRPLPHVKVSNGCNFVWNWDILLENFRITNFRSKQNPHLQFFYLIFTSLYLVWCYWHLLFSSYSDWSNNVQRLLIKYSATDTFSEYIILQGIRGAAADKIWTRNLFKFRDSTTRLLANKLSIKVSAEFLNLKSL